uniref:Uncharacterized protein n=1 Tax=Vespula pensylvanica TaxID=30213 RepID=A0A834N0P6_VESPE|nr:hypothetical protein H0235_017399 [Vespula pensylvanica]
MRRVERWWGSTCLDWWSLYEAGPYSSVSANRKQKKLKKVIEGEPEENRFLAASSIDSAKVQATVKVRGATRMQGFSRNEEAMRAMGTAAATKKKIIAIESRKGDVSRLLQNRQKRLGRWIRRADKLSEFHNTLWARIDGQGYIDLLSPEVATSLRPGLVLRQATKPASSWASPYDEETEVIPG